MECTLYGIGRNKGKSGAGRREREERSREQEGKERRGKGRNNEGRTSKIVKETKKREGTGRKWDRK